jgi:hypothetical protein
MENISTQTEYRLDIYYSARNTRQGLPLRNS